MIDKSDVETEAKSVADPFREVLAASPNTPVAPAHGIAAIALSMAIRYHDFSTIKDGAMYQQYKLEGRNMREVNLDVVFETAILMEMHLLGSSERIAKLVVDALEIAVDEHDEKEPAPEKSDK